MAELDGSYSGVVLTFAKGAEFKKGGQAPSMLPALRRRLVGSEGALLYVMLCGLLLVVPGLVIPTFTRIFVDDYLVGSQEWIVRPLLWCMAATIVIQAVLTWLQQLLPAAPRDQARARHLEPLLLAHPAAAGGLLRPALRRRDRLARRDQRRRRQDHRRPGSRPPPSTAS